MSQKTIIDVHCHLFNAKYAVKELVAITWNSIRGRYPHYSNVPATTGEKTIEKRGLVEIVEGAGELISYVARLVKVAKNDCDSNHSYMCEQFKESSIGFSKSFKSVPLMMDIYYALDNNENDLPEPVKRKTAEFEENEFIVENKDTADFREHLEGLKKSIQDELGEDLDTSEDIPQKRASGDILDSIFDSIENDLLKDTILKRGKSDYPDVEMSPGFKEHLEALIELEAANKGSVFPFLAVDPRRRGIMSLIKKMVKKNGPFYGIKLYPPLGYLPTHPALVEIFEYCSKEENDIPVTVHCSLGGVKNFKKMNFVLTTENGKYPNQINGIDKSDFYANPENWIPVLEKWNNLRINFAHFGGSVQYGKKDTKWMDTIISILQSKSYPNVYTDLSYFLKAGVMAEILHDNQSIKDKIMFGTDYIMIMLEKDLGGLKEYYNNSNTIDAFDDAFYYENAKKFLGRIIE